MKKIFVLILFIAGLNFFAKAQEGYTVNGKIEGVPDGPLLLMTYDGGKSDTLGLVRTEGGAFRFTGKTEGAVVAYIMTADRKGVIPLILENAEFTVNVGSAGIVITGGGAQQEIYSRFLALNEEEAVARKNMEEDFRIARQEQNGMKMQAIQQQFRKLYETTRAKEEKLLEKYANSFAAAYVVAASAQGLEPEVLKKRFDMLSDYAKTTPPGRSVAGLMEQYRKVAVGSVAPDFNVQTPDGNTLSLYDIKAKVKLVDFWASWCAPCRQENPNVVKIYGKFHKQGLEILSVSLDKDRNAWIKAIEEDKLSWNHGIDGGDVARQYFVKGIPHTILLDENNVIVAKNLRGNALRKKIAEMLKK